MEVAAALDGRYRYPDLFVSGEGCDGVQPSEGPLRLYQTSWHSRTPGATGHLTFLASVDVAPAPFMSKIQNVFDLWCPTVDYTQAALPQH